MRPMRWTDIGGLVALERDLFPDDAWTAPTWWAELATRPRRDYVVEEGPDGTIDGYAGVDLGGEVADVMTMAVAPA
ncbi:MAG TPA: ribosomal-protein-alanine N-acetyltransferase RimI, partial [Pedococcus sp.]